MKLLPLLHINRQILKNNFLKAKNKCEKMGAVLRPHVKTVHDPVVVESLFELGLEKVTVSNPQMMLDFYKAGIHDICLALPFSFHFVYACNDYLKDPNTVLMVVVDHIDQLSALAQLNRSVLVMIEVDVGQMRSGIDWRQVNRCQELIHAIHQSDHSFSGLTVHFGHHYSAQNARDIRLRVSESMSRILQLRENLAPEFGPIPLAIGDTPSLHSSVYFEYAFEIRAGNFLINDLTMVDKGLCTIQDVAAAVACPIIGKYESDNRLVAHVGSVHLSKECHPNPAIRYGWVLRSQDGLRSQRVAGARLLDLYQEHAVIVMSPEDIETFNIGDTIFVLPVHSCLTMDAMIHKRQFQMVA